MSEIWRGFYGVLQHADEEEDPQKERMRKIFASLNDEQKELLFILVGKHVDGDEAEEEEVEHADEGKTYKDIYDTLNDDQKELFDFVLGAIKDVVDEVVNSDDDDDDDEIEHSELMHYGVIGMKWGQRRYQNPDGSLTAKGKKRYGENGKYEYKSMYTKMYEKSASKLEAKANKAKAKGNSAKAAKFTAKMKNRKELAEASKKMDQKYQEYAKTTSVGKAIAQNLIFGSSIRTRMYQQSRALGQSRFAAAGQVYLFTLIPFGPELQRRATVESLRPGGGAVGSTLRSAKKKFGI